MIYLCDGEILSIEGSYDTSLFERLGEEKKIQYGLFLPQECDLLLNIKIQQLIFFSVQSNIGEQSLCQGSEGKIRKFP